jgi:hypothetical protein
MFADRVAAMPGRFGNILIAAAELLEPETQTVQLPRRMLKTEADIDMWIEEIRQQLKSVLAKGPIVTR